MQLGDKVRFIPSVTAGDRLEGPRGKRAQQPSVTGRVVYIHPQRRFYIVEWAAGGRTLRETLYFDG